MYNLFRLYICILDTGNTLLCVRRFEPGEDITMHVVPGKYFFKIF